MDSANDGDFGSLKEIYEEQKSMLQKRELLEYKNEAASTALHLAASMGHADIVEYIVSRIEQDFNEALKVWVNRKNKYHFTPLMCVCFRGYLTKGMAKDS